MYATEDFRLRMTPKAKKALAFLARRDGRSMAKMIERLVFEKYEIIQAESKQPQHERGEVQHAQA